METSRRRFIIGSALLPLANFPKVGLGDETNANTKIVVLEALGQTLSPQLAAQVLEVFFAKGIPVTVLLRCDGVEQAPLAQGFVGPLTQIAARERGLLEVALELDQPAETERYFQLRAAMAWRDCLLAGESKDTGPATATPIVSLLNRAVKEMQEPFALRAAGFRIQLRPALDENKKTVSAASAFEVIDWGLAHITGGSAAPIESNPMAIPALSEAANGIRVLYLSFENAAALSPEALLARCNVWATQLQTTMLAENTFLTRPMDHLLQGHPGASKYVGLLLDMASKPGAKDQMAAFASRLDYAGFPYTLLLPEGAPPVAAAGDICTIASGAGQPEPGADAGCVVLSGAAGQAVLSEIILEPSQNPYFWSGPRSDGRYHAAIRMSGVARFAELLEEDPLTDTLFVIGPQHVPTAVQQEALIAQIDQARNDGKAHFYSVRAYVAQTLAPDPVLERFWSTARRQVSDPAESQNLSAAEKDRLLADARLAWRFIERNSDAETGICAGTVLTGRVNIANQGVTLWDVASQLHGIMSARDLKIIPKEEAEARVARIMAHLPVIPLDGLPLPPSLFNAENTAILRQEFDACDTGRFLIALDKLVAAKLLTKPQAVAVLARWDIGSTLQNNRPFNFENGAWKDVSQSHCAHYARNGFNAWEMPMDSPYPALAGAEAGDQNIRLLYKAAFIGHFGTEPLLLEALDSGFSPETKYLSDVLFDAQLTWYEETGNYKCVSETALDFAPWFAYQGLRVDRRGQDSWVISTISNNADYKTSRFYERADIISSKAAFLWAAIYPHSYSSRLLALIREKAQIEGLGFSVGVFSKTGQAMAGYSDVNTNGIILTAIAHMLKKA